MSGYYNRSKYKAKKVYDGNLVFDSKKEHRRWKELTNLENSGEISELERQVKFVLIPAAHEPDRIGPRGGVKRGKLIERECAYIADFVYVRNGERVVEDTKGMRTPDYIIKRKLMLRVYGIRIHEI